MKRIDVGLFRLILFAAFQACKYSFSLFSYKLLSGLEFDYVDLLRCFVLFVHVSLLLETYGTSVVSPILFVVIFATSQLFLVSVSARIFAMRRFYLHSSKSSSFAVAYTTRKRQSV